MRPAPGQFNAVAPVGKRAIRGVAVALDRAGKIHRDEVVQARGGAAGFPAVKHIAARPAARPQITLFGFPVPGFQIIHRGFIHLHISAAHHPGADLLVNGFQPFRGQFHPPGQTLPRQVNSVALPVNLFLPVQGKMVAVFSHHNVGQQTRRRQAAVQQPFGQGRDEGRAIGVGPVNVLSGAPPGDGENGPVRNPVAR